MRALILVGGFGTRLRPLTLDCPKPMVQFGNKSIVLHQIEALIEVGVTEVVLAVQYQPEEMMAELEAYGANHPSNIKITSSLETHPLGTAGPLKLAEQLLHPSEDDQEPFIVLNSDVICEFPFADLIAFHKAHGAEGTIMVTPVEEPSKYGVVLSQEDGCIDRFVEKPVEYVGNRINAGMYIFNPDILKRIPEDTCVSIEREVFPAMVAENQLYSFDLPGFWMDIGQPPDYLKGMVMYLDSLAKNTPDALAQGGNILGNVLIADSAQVDDSAVLGPDVVVGPGCVVGPGVRLQRTTLLEGASVAEHSWLKSAIVGWESSVGRWCRIDGVTVLGKDVTIRDELYINGARILPHKTIKECVSEPTIVM